jgi:hypothetical protein
MKSFEEQLEQERAVFGTIKSVERKRGGPRSSENDHKSFSEIQSGWKGRLTGAIEREIELVMAGNKGERKLLYFFCVNSPLSASTLPLISKIVWC